MAMAWLSMSVAKTCTLKLCFSVSMLLLEQDGDGIGFLAGGAAGHPDADRGARGLAGKEPRDDLFLERLEGLRVAEEIGDADQQVAKERLHLGRGLLQIADVLVQPFDLVDGHAPLDAAVDGALLVLGKVVAGLGAQQDEDLLQRVSRPWEPGAETGRDVLPKAWAT